MGLRADLDGRGKLCPNWDFFFCIFEYSLCTSSVLSYCSLFSYILCFCLYLQYAAQTSVLPAGFEPATPASDRPQTFALDRSATGIGIDPKTIEPVASRYTD